MNKIITAVIFLTTCCYANVDQFATFVTHTVHSGKLENGRLQGFVKDFTNAIDQNPLDYESRVCRVLASGLSLVENQKMQKILSSFGFAIDFGKCSVVGEAFPASRWTKVNEVSDALLEQCKPVLKLMFEDLCAIPESWGGFVLDPGKWPIDETVTLDYADVQYIKSQCWSVLGMLYFIGAYDIDVDYEKAEEFFTSQDPLRGLEPRIPVLSKQPSLTSDSGWENAAIATVGENDYIDAFRVAFFDDKMYVRLVVKPGVSLPDNVGYEFIADLDGEIDRGDMYFNPWDTHRDNNKKKWCWNWDYYYDLEFYDDGKTFVFELPEEILSNKETISIEWMEIGIATVEVHTEYNEYWDEEWTRVSWDYLDWADADDFIPCFWHFVVEQTGIFQKVRNKNNLIYAREYFRLALDQMKIALAADEKRQGSNLRLIECCALEDYPYIKDRFHKYINRATESLESVTSVDINDFSYFKSTGDIASSETVGNFIKLIGNNGVFSMSLAPLFNGLTPRDYLPGLSLGRYFSSVSIDMSKMKDPTFAGILPDATDLFWYDFADDKATQFYYIGTPRASVKPSIIPVNKFKPRDLIGVENKYVLFGEITDETLESVASVYEGVLSDKDGNCSGSIQLKVASSKNDIAKVTVTIQITGEKKVSVKGELNVESRVLEAVDKDGRKLSLEFGSGGVKGSFGAYEIDGARNFFSSKNKDEKSDAENALAPWLGTLNMKCPDGVFSVTIAKKGKVTVKGTYNGEKVSVKAQALIGEDMICIPVMYSKKLVNLAFAIWLPIGGNNAEIVGLEDAVIGKAGTLVNGAKFNIEGDITELIPTAIEKIDGYGVLPDGESVSVSGKKWVVADGVKAAKVTYKKGELDIAEGKKGQQVIANASGLKLTYKSKDGSFTGSFTVYAIEKGKLKKHKATVTGVLIDGIGYGTAMIKKIGDWVVEIR